MPQSPPGSASFRLAQVYGEHFFVTASDLTVRAVLERMRDEACPIAVLTENEQIVGLIEGGSVLASVVGQPARWSEPARTVAVVAPILDENAGAEALRAHLAKDAAVVVVKDATGRPFKVITRASWLRYLNFQVNTAVFQASPHIEADAHPVAR